MDVSSVLLLGLFALLTHLAKKPLETLQKKVSAATAAKFKSTLSTSRGEATPSL